jgi:hypothetical protein
MIDTSKQIALRSNRLSRYLGFTAAVLMAGSISAQAAPESVLLAGDVEIQAKLPNVNGKQIELKNATDKQILQAAIKAIANPKFATKTIVAQIVYAAGLRIPDNSGEICGHAVAAIYASNLDGNEKNIQATVAMMRAMGAALRITPKRGSDSDSSDVAAQVIAFSVLATKDLPAPADKDLLDPLQTVIRAGVRIALVHADSDKNGAPGVVTSAVNRTAGVNNKELKESAADKLVRKVIATAVQTAPDHSVTIAQAAAYSFAATYLATHKKESTRLTKKEFYNLNKEAFLAAVFNGLTKEEEDTYENAIKVAITNGVKFAYKGTRTSGTNGVENFDNGNSIPVTNSGGL